MFRSSLLILFIAALIVAPVLAQDATITMIEIADRPLLGTTAAGQDIMLGGFSGLYFEGMDEDGSMIFITHPDRGPNGEPFDTDGDGVNERPFPLPDFQLRWVRLSVNAEAGTAAITEQVLLTDGEGNPLTGLPNLAGEAGMAYADEIPVDLMGNLLDYDPLGGDMEGIVRADDGTYWMVDEYRPAIYHFTPDGVMAARYVPEGTPEEAGTAAFPAVYAQRRANRGFEAVAYSEGILYAFIQSPIDNPDLPDDASSKGSLVMRILAFDTATATTVGEYLYIHDEASDKIGDAVALGGGEFLVLERDDATGAEAHKLVYRISLEGATNLQDLDAETAGMVESMTPEALEAAGVIPVSKEVYVDLIAMGYDMVDKPEGLALVDENTIAVLNDNDFELLGGFDPATGMLEANPSPFPVVLALITVGE